MTQARIERGSVFPRSTAGIGIRTVYYHQPEQLENSHPIVVASALSGLVSCPPNSRIYASYRTRQFLAQFTNTAVRWIPTARWTRSTFSILIIRKIFLVGGIGFLCWGGIGFLCWGEIGCLCCVAFKKISQILFGWQLLQGRWRNWQSA